MTSFLVPGTVVMCARCGYRAWRDGYPCNRCGGLKARVYVPVDEVRDLLERAYHPQNPTSDHPVDVFNRYVTRVRLSA